MARNQISTKLMLPPLETIFVSENRQMLTWIKRSCVSLATSMHRLVRIKRPSFKGPDDEPTLADELALVAKLGPLF